MGSRLVKVRCHGEVKRLRMTVCTVREVICRGFGIPANAEIKLTMGLANGARLPLTSQWTLLANWINFQELQVTLTLQGQRARVNPHDLQIVVRGIGYRIDKPPSPNSQVVQEYRGNLGTMQKIAEFRDICPKTSSLVRDLYRSVSDLMASYLYDSNDLVTKSRSVVKSLICAFAESETAFGGFINLCVTIKEVLQQLSLDLVQGDHQAAVDALKMLMSKGDEMERGARDLEGSIQRSMQKIDVANKTIVNEKVRIENKVDCTTREKERTERNVMQQSEEIDRLERKVREYRNAVDKKETTALVSGAATGAGLGLTVVGVLFPPLLIAAIPAALTSGVILKETLNQLEDLGKGISAANDKKGQEERRRNELEQTLNKLRGNLRKLEAVAACLHDVLGHMNSIKSNVLTMKSFWPGLNDFCRSMMASEQPLVEQMEREYSNPPPGPPLRESQAFKSQIVAFMARSVALQEVCQSCHGDARAAVSNMWSYQDMF